MVPVRARALRKAAVAAGIVCALALAAGLMLVRRGGERAVDTPGESRAETGTIAVAVESGVEDPAAREESAAEASPLELRGTLVLIDAEGAEHPEEDGEFRILRSAPGEKPISVDVTAGKWQAAWPGPAFPTELHLMGIRAGEAEAEVEGHLPVDASGEVVIRARWLPPAPVLEVVAKDTGAGLRGIKVVLGSIYIDAATSKFMAASPHSGSLGPELTIVESSDSPLVLERAPGNTRRLQGRQSVWARAPGYAWGSTEIDFGLGGQHILTLEREATLEVTILSRTPPGTDEDPAVLRIRRAPESKELEDLEEIDKFLAEIASQAEAKQILDEQISSIRETRERIEGGGCEGETVASVAPQYPEVTRIEGVPPGRFAVCVELGGSLADPVVLGSAPTVLRGGETTRLVIPLADPEPMGHFEGTIEVPEIWGKVALSVHVELLDKAKVSPGQGWRHVEVTAVGRGVHAWSAGKVPPGRYQVLVHSFGLVEVFDVPPEGKRDALIRVGEPVEVRVKVVDARTGEDIEDAGVTFSPVSPADGASVAMRSTEEDPGAREHTFRTPAGRVNIRAESDGYRTAEEKLDLAPGAKAATLRLERACGAFLTLDGYMPSDQEKFWRGIRFEPQEGSGHTIGSQWVPAEVALKITVDSPGLYELHVPRVEGFAPVEPIRIEIPPDRYVEQTITLRRE